MCGKEHAQLTYRKAWSALVAARRYHDERLQLALDRDIPLEPTQGRPRLQARNKLERVVARERVRRSLQWLTTRRGLGILFVVGFLARFALSFNTGYAGDLRAQQGWATQLAEHGPAQFFEPNLLDDLPPYFYFGYSPILYVIGQLSTHVLDRPPPYVLLKLPAILADLALAWVAMIAAVRLWPEMRKREVRALAAAFVLVNPAFIYVSAVWGQVDSVGALMVVGGLTLIGTGSRSLRAELGGAALLGVALCTKPQSVFVLPVVALVLLARHLRGGGAVLGSLRLLGLGAVTFVAFVAPGIPFGLTPYEMIQFPLQQGPRVLSVSAFNLWAVLGFYNGDTGRPGDPRILGLIPHDVGIALFLVGTLVVAFWVVKLLRAGEADGRVLFAGAAALNCLGFAVLTRVHERYLLLGLACLVPLVGRRAFRLVLAALSGLLLLNLFLSYTLTVFDERPHGFRIEPFYGWVYGTELASPQQRVLGVLGGALCLLVVGLGGRWLREWRTQ